MKGSKSVILGLALVVVIVIGYAAYLHRGPMKRMAEEHQERVAEIDQWKTALATSKADVRVELDEKTRLIEELERKAGELEQTVSRIQEEKRMTEADVEELQSTIALLESDRETLSGKSEDLGRRLQDSKKQLDALDKELEAGKKAIAEATIEKEAMKDRIDLVVGERDRLEQTRTELENRLTELRNRLQSTSDDLAAKDRKIAEMENIQQTLEGQIERQKKEQEELDRLKNGLRTQLGMTQSQIASLSMEAEAKEEQLKTKEKQLKSMEKAMEELSKQFERQIKEKEIQISALEDKLSIRLVDKILFSSGSADITPAGHRVLESLATELRNMEGFEIAVSGHTDNVPLGPKIKELYYDNLGLSVARAAAVSRVLREEGVNPENLSAVGHSMYRPVAGNDTQEGRRQNRRVEIILAPMR
jgi:chemotaxis protein MotB